jgi:predicted aldo/keto reductase-like oxidoreductase
MDNLWDYNNGDGQGEWKMGKALRDGYRQKVFLVTKVDRLQQGPRGQATG